MHKELPGALLKNADLYVANLGTFFNSHLHPTPRTRSTLSDWTLSFLLDSLLYPTCPASSETLTQIQLVDSSQPPGDTSPKKMMNNGPSRHPSFHSGWETAWLPWIYRQEFSLCWLQCIPCSNKDDERPAYFQPCAGDWLAGLKTPALLEVGKLWGNIFHAERDNANCSASGTNRCMATWIAEEQAKTDNRKMNRECGRGSRKAVGCLLPPFSVLRSLIPCTAERAGWIERLTMESWVHSYIS